MPLFLSRIIVKNSPRAHIYGHAFFAYNQLLPLNYWHPWTIQTLLLASVDKTDFTTGLRGQYRLSYWPPRTIVIPTFLLTSAVDNTDLTTGLRGQYRLFYWPPLTIPTLLLATMDNTDFTTSLRGQYRLYYWPPWTVPAHRRRYRLFHRPP